jgi:hypothetical protein
MQQAMEGQAREVRGEDKDGGGGDERNKSLALAMTKLSPLLHLPFKK